jgi:hypothetical protein
MSESFGPRYFGNSNDDKDDFCVDVRVKMKRLVVKYGKSDHEEVSLSVGDTANLKFRDCEVEIKVKEIKDEKS